MELRCVSEYTTAWGNLLVFAIEDGAVGAVGENFAIK